MIAVIDMGMGNLQSVCRACEHVGAQIAVASKPNDLERCRAIILPGVGAFGDGMWQLRERGFADALHKQAKAGKPILGICLGMQLLAEEGEEYGLHTGLGLIRGRVVRLQPSGNGDRIPHIGWCDVRVEHSASILFREIPSDSSFYFAHSYVMACADSTASVATFAFGKDRPAAAVEQGSIFGVQFHPEKSQDVGLELLHNFWMFSRQ